MDRMSTLSVVFAMKFALFFLFPFGLSPDIDHVADIDRKGPILRTKGCNCYYEGDPQGPTFPASFKTAGNKIPPYALQSTKSYIVLFNLLSQRKPHRPLAQTGMKHRPRSSVVRFKTGPSYHLPSITDIERQIFGNEAVDDYLKQERSLELGIFNPASVLWPDDAPEYRDSPAFISSWLTAPLIAPSQPADFIPRRGRSYSWGAYSWGVAGVQPSPSSWLESIPRFMNTPKTQIHAWLNGDAPSSIFHFDLGSGQFNPRRLISTNPPQTTAVGRELSESAFYPNLTQLRILHPCLPYWPVDIPYWSDDLERHPEPSPVESAVITLGDLLLALHSSMQQCVTQAEWETINEEDKREVMKAQESRCYAEAVRSGVPYVYFQDREQAEQDQGIKRVDLLFGKT
ncbi:hypothetical protein FB451DRAFT_1414763 [Mycena latifolia]|nr:hypothetical protein FB451DRAFT_1414763 [Mycena latifolia]